MLLPYASDRKPTKRPTTTYVLLVLNGLILAAMLMLDRLHGAGSTAAALRTLGIVPARFQWYTLVTYMFLHESPLHLLANEFSLWVFGAGVEEALGSARFFGCYVAAGALAGGLQCLVTSTVLPPILGYTPIVGASGACAGLVGLFAVRYYRARLQFAGIPYRPHVVYVIVAYLAVQVVGGIYEVASGSTAGMVAYWAHIGGFAFGLSTAYLFRLESRGSTAYVKLDAADALERSMPGDAIKRWEALMRREPDNATARVELARAWLAFGDFDQAGVHYEEAIAAHLRRNQRSEAALVYAEIRDRHVRTAHVGTGQLFLLGNALEELGQFDVAADTLRAATIRAPDSPAAEPALLKVAAIYIKHLNRREEARILLLMFRERYPRSQFRRMADELLASAR